MKEETGKRLVVLGALIPTSSRDENDAVIRLHTEIGKISAYEIDYVKLKAERIWRIGRYFGEATCTTVRYQNHRITIISYSFIARYHPLRALFSWMSVRGFVKCKRVMSSVERGALIHAYGLFPAGFIARKMKEYGCEYVLNLRYEIEELHRNPFGVAELIITGAKSIVTPSPRVAELVKNKYNRYASVIEHGVDKPSEVPNDYDVSRFVVLTVARFTKIKRIVEHIVAIRDFIEEDDNNEYWIVGDGPEMGRIKEAAAGVRGRVIVRGWREGAELSKLYASAHIFYLVSIKETFGRVYQEALAHGVPVVATAYSGFYENYDTNKYVVGLEGLERKVVTSIMKNIKDQIHSGAISRSAVANTLARYRWQDVAHRYKSILE